MPIYCYCCQECSNLFSEVRQIRDRNGGATCECGGTAVRDHRSTDGRSRNPNFNKPIEMWSIAPNTPAEHRQLAEAGATFGELGVPLAHNRAEKKKLMEVVGHVELN